MWWKTILKIAVAVGLDKWAKKKAKALIEKYSKKAEDKAKKIKEAVEEKVEEWVSEDGKSIVTKTGDKVTVRPV